jgi:hypothetical protein
MRHESVIFSDQIGDQSHPKILTDITYIDRGCFICCAVHKGIIWNGKLETLVFRWIIDRQFSTGHLLHKSYEKAEKPLVI